MKTFALALSLALATAAASAQTPPTSPAPVRVRAARPYRGELIPIDGVVPHPYYWVQTRAALHYQAPEPRRAFAPTVVRAVREAPF